MDLSANLRIVLRALKHVTVAVQLLRIQTAEVFTAAVADEERAEDNILDLMILSVDCPAWSHAIELALVIADDTNLLFKRIIGLDTSADGFLLTAK